MYRGFPKKLERLYIPLLSYKANTFCNFCATAGILQLYVGQFVTSTITLYANMIATTMTVAACNNAITIALFTQHFPRATTFGTFCMTRSMTT